MEHKHVHAHIGQNVLNINRVSSYKYRNYNIQFIYKKNYHFTKKENINEQTHKVGNKQRMNK